MLVNTIKSTITHIIMLKNNPCTQRIKLTLRNLQKQQVKKNQLKLQSKHKNSKTNQVNTTHPLVLFFFTIVLSEIEKNKLITFDINETITN